MITDREGQVNCACKEEQGKRNNARDCGYKPCGICEQHRGQKEQAHHGPYVDSFIVNRE